MNTGKWLKLLNFFLASEQSRGSFSLSLRTFLGKGANEQEPLRLPQEKALPRHAMPAHRVHRLTRGEASGHLNPLKVTNDPNPPRSGCYTRYGDEIVHAELKSVAQLEVSSLKSEEDKVAVTLLSKEGYQRTGINVWLGQEHAVHIDDQGNIAGGDDILDDHERRISAAELVPRTHTQVALHYWNEAERAVVIDLDNNIAGGEDIQNDHEGRITALENSGEGRSFTFGPQYEPPFLDSGVLKMLKAGGPQTVLDPAPYAFTRQPAWQNKGIVTGWDRPTLGLETPVVVASDGTLVHPSATALLILAAFGQSNARGSGAWPPDGVPTTTNPHPTRLLMADGIGMNVALGTGGGDNYGPIDPYDITGFQPLVSLELDGGGGVTICEGAGYHLSKLTREKLGYDPLYTYFTAAKGGASLAERSKGTVPYDNFITAIQRFHDLALAQGLPSWVPAMFDVEGEANASTATYATDLVAQLADMNADVKTITGQIADMVMIMSQPSSFFSSTDGVRGIYDVSKSATTHLLACPGYFLPYQDDLLHYSPVGQAKLGEYLVRAFVHWMTHGVWRPLMPKTLTWDNGTGLDVEFHVPSGNLVHDASGIDHEGHWGFDVRSADSFVEIVSQDITGPASMHFELATIPTTSRFLRYGMRGYQSSPRTPGDGPGGAMRDSDTTPSFVDGQPLRNWMVHFQEQF